MLITPPLLQLNTPYPATMQLTGFLLSQQIATTQLDLGIELIDTIFTSKQLSILLDEIEHLPKLSKRSRQLLVHRSFIVTYIEPAIRFLRNQDLTLANRFSQPLFWQDVIGESDEEHLLFGFGESGVVDQAKYLTTRFIKEIAQLIQETTHPHFQLIRYAESLTVRLPDFAPLEQELLSNPTTIDLLMLQLLHKHIQENDPEWIGLSVPFPGNLYGAMRCAQYVKQNFPNIKVVMGGGYVNTELRQIEDVSFFKYVDYLTFDDGELPLLRLFTGGELIRTAFLKDGNIYWSNRDSVENISFSNWGNPSMVGIKQSLYLDMVETTNPMHRLWSVGRWNKLMMAHGCYWAKCTFCDTRLDYIGRFEQASAAIVVDRMESLMAQTNISGFHFVDEAAPPALLRKIAEEILSRKLVVSYWVNIRFDKTFTPELSYLLAKSGCIAVSGGLEVASERVLKLINKGVTVDSARLCMENLSQQGIMVHAYLMYGFPTQTVSELYDSLTQVRNLFQIGVLQSTFWHRYAMTIHSPSGNSPESIGAKAVEHAVGSFANNEIPFITQPDIDWDKYAQGLSLATYNYMQGTGFELPIKKWFK